MDRTILYREIVRFALDGQEEPVETQSVEEDEFTREINSIASSLTRLRASLKQMRPRYLAMSGFQQMRDSEKDDFDYLVKQMLQNEQRRVRALEQREKLRFESSKPSGFAARWLANPETEGVSETLYRHRQGMLFYLNSVLQNASYLLAELQHIRNARSAVARPVDDTSSIKPAVMDPELAQSGVKEHAPLPPQLTDLDSVEPEIPESHMQLLLEEHDTLMEDLNANLEKAQRAEQSLQEVASLQSELSQHLSTQAQKLDSLTTDAFRTTADITGANEQLDRAKRSNRRASRVIIFSSLATGVFLLLLNGR